MSQNQNEADASAIAPLAVNKRVARAMLGGISETSIWRLEQRQLIKAIPGLRHKLYSVESLKRFVNGGKVAA